MKRQEEEREERLKIEEEEMAKEEQEKNTCIEAFVSFIRAIKDLANEIILARPELTEVLKSEFSREGVNL